MELKDLKEQVLKCERCGLCKDKTNYVFGEGNEKAKIIFIGEAPGANEDKTGRPFVGKAGGIFDELLASLDLERGDIFIANVLKCRPPNNRNPSSGEIKACTPFLDKQIEIIKPKVICPMGNFATEFILKKYGLKSELKGISKLHGQILKVSNLFENLEIIPFYHPAVATYAPEMKEALLKDFELLRDRK